jgi:glycosyltransferase involved in cell wall biosynthesis
MRVAINAHFWDQPTTGSGQYLRNLVKELKRAFSDHEFLLIGPSEAGIEHRVSTPFACACGAGTGDSRHENLAKLWFEQFAFPHTCRNLGADLAHVPYFASPLAPSIPTVVTIHDLIPMVLPAYRGGVLVRLYTSLVAAAATRAKTIITDSAASRRDIVARLGIPAERVRVIYLAAEARYRPVVDPAQREAVRQKYGLPDRCVLYLGGVDQRKNLPGLLHAYTWVVAALKGQYPLVLAGRLPEPAPPLFPDLRRKVAELGLEKVVQLIGQVDEADKPALYSIASLFVYPSRYEGFGLPVLEAMACGTPVVASNAASLPEIVGGAGFLVDPDDGQGMAGAIIAALIQKDLHASLREKGLAQAARFTWEKTARETLAVYQEALA